MALISRNDFFILLGLEVQGVPGLISNDISFTVGKLPSGYVLAWPFPYVWRE